jgi:hypothetical protein
MFLYIISHYSTPINTQTMHHLVFAFSCEFKVHLEREKLRQICVSIQFSKYIRSVC